MFGVSGRLPPSLSPGLRLEAKIHPLFWSDKQAVRQINSKATRAPAACSTLGNGSGCANALVGKMSNRIDFDHMTPASVR